MHTAALRCLAPDEVAAIAVAHDAHEVDLERLSFAPLLLEDDAVRDVLHGLAIVPRIVEADGELDQVAPALAPVDALVVVVAVRILVCGAVMLATSSDDSG